MFACWPFIIKIFSHFFSFSFSIQKLLCSGVHMSYWWPVQFKWLTYSIKVDRMLNYAYTHSASYSRDSSPANWCNCNAVWTLMRKTTFNFINWFPDVKYTFYSIWLLLLVDDHGVWESNFIAGALKRISVQTFYTFMFVLIRSGHVVMISLMYHVFYWWE